MCIADLGLACRKNDYEYLKHKVGTPTYVAPEILAGSPFSNKSDIFSLGSFLYNLIACKPLFKGYTHNELLHHNQYTDAAKLIEKENL